MLAAPFAMLAAPFGRPKVGAIRDYTMTKSFGGPKVGASRDDYSMKKQNKKYIYIYIYSFGRPKVGATCKYMYDFGMPKLVQTGNPRPQTW
jgi:hypothetical protein